MSVHEQDTTTMNRRSLMTLQHTAAVEENLVARPSKTLKHQLNQENSTEVEVKRKNVASKETQASDNNKITSEDLTNPDSPSGHYWKILAEKLEIALQDSLDENDKLRKIIEDLKNQAEVYKQMLEEANSFVEVIKEELANGSKDDTGIDVNDVSTADDTSTFDDSTNENTKN